MNLTRLCLNNPAAVAVTLAMVVVMGAMSIKQLPVKLLPNIERPILSVNANWRGASPREIESEVIEPIERELQGLPGMRSISSSAGRGGGRIRMEYDLGTDMDKAFNEVNARLQRVTGLPADVDPPRINRGGGRGGGGDAERLIFLFAQQLPNAPDLGMPLGDFLESRVIPELEKVEGVAGVDMNRNDGTQIVKIEFDPYRLAQYQLDINRVAQVVNRSTDVSGGAVEVGRRDYTLRYEGRFGADQLEDTPLDFRNGSPIRLGDVATVTVGPDAPRGVVYQNGNPAIGMPVLREPGTNTLAAIDALTKVLDDLNASTLEPLGIRIEKSFDPTVFIKRAIALLSSNLIIGISLAVGALWLFIRRIRATLLIAAAIPICLLSTIVTLNLFGRTINIISLAGLAFATGMVLDAAIVVLENFVRLRERGLDRREAAEASVGQVGGALFASTVTTVAIFIPILFFEDVEGQLFADLALTIAVAVSFSLIVALTVLPTGAAQFIRAGSPGERKTASGLWDRVAAACMSITATPSARLASVLGLTLAPIALAVLLWPQLNYLPPVKRDAVDARLSLPSGISVTTFRTEIAEEVVRRLDPYMKGEKQPALKNYYFFSGPWGGNLGVRALDQSRVKELERIVNTEILSGFPDVRAFAFQGNLFGGFGGNASIRLDLQSNDSESLAIAVEEAAAIIREVLPGSQVRPDPDPQVVNPEIRVIPNDRRIAEVGMSRDGLARTIRALGDGLWLGEFFYEGERIDMFLRSQTWDTPEFLETAPIATPGGAVVTLGELATVVRSAGPTEINRLDGRRTISLGINPPDRMALGTAVATIEADAEPRIRELLPPGSTLKYGGDADALKRAIANLGGNFALAVMLLFLIMAALFKSVKDAALVIITLPMAAIGGVFMLRLVDLFSPTPLDLLGMIGFIILLGLVVNNAILLVSQTRASEAEGKNRREAVHDALRLRVRPIFMSTSTSLMGMLPLLLAPGTGSLIYRGLAAVIVGGMAVSTLFTLILLPALLQIGEGRMQPNTVPAGFDGDPDEPLAIPAE